MRTKGISMGKRNQYLATVCCSVIIWHLMLEVTCSFLSPTLDLGYCQLPQLTTYYYVPNLKTLWFAECYHCS